MACGAVPGLSNLASALVSYIDCQTLTIATRGYMALALGNGIGPSLLLVVVTLYFALWGYRLLAGDRPGFGELLPSFARLAIVLTLASSWPAYQRLVFDVVLQTPAQVAGTIDLSETGRDDGAGLAARLDDTDARFVRLATLGTGAPRSPEEAELLRTSVAPPLFLNFDNFAIGSARLIFLISAVGAFALIRLLSGALLALGPLIILALLFEVSRGLVVGWARLLAGLVVGGIVTILVINVETMLLAPWLSDLIVRRAAEQLIYGAPAQLLAASVIFALVTLGGVRLSARIMATVWPQQRLTVTGSHHGSMPSWSANPQAVTASAGAQKYQEQRRAQAVADSITVADHRRTRLATAGGQLVAPGVSAQPLAPGWQGARNRPAATAMRRSSWRGSASATRRDQR